MRHRKTKPRDLLAGVLREQGFTERATFIVDKEGIIRFIHIYDLNELPDNEELFQALEEIN